MIPFHSPEELSTFINDFVGNRTCFGFTAIGRNFFTKSEYHGCGNLPTIKEIYFQVRKVV